MEPYKIAYLLHGTFSSKQLMDIAPVKGMLALAGYKIRVPEYIGHGKRNGERNPFFIYDTMMEINAAIKNEPGKVVVIGHSMGGAIGLSLAMINKKIKKTFAISAPNGRHMAGKERVETISKLLNKDLINTEGKEFRQIIKIMPMLYGDNIAKKSNSIYLIHCESDDIVPIEEYNENVEMLNVKEENRLLIKKITSNGLMDHAMLLNDIRTLKFIKKRLLVKEKE